MIVRKMTIQDIPEVVEIEKECFSLPWSEKSFEDSVTREDTFFLVCEEKIDQMQDEIVVAGYIGLYISFDEASITNVAVSPDYRKRGVGRALVSKAKAAAKSAGAVNIFLEVRVSNEPALSLYKEAGFETLGIRKNFYEHPTEDAFIMRCDLGSLE